VFSCNCFLYSDHVEPQNSRNGNKPLKRNFRLFGIIAIAVAILFWLAETTFYGDVDANGVLQESLFLPLTFLFAIVGIMLIAASLFIKSRG